jgi:UDP-N-acetylglucosamine 2-epimerase (non-hydrolysing)
MRVMTILGTRPEIIRLSGVIRLLDLQSEHTLVHTGQNFEDRLSRIFFEELNVRTPDIFMGVRAPTFSGQIGQILEKSEKLFDEIRPDRLLILGDTNSGLSAIVARRLGIPVYHMEAGNRCYDDRVPEEVNRRVIDHSSSVLMPYTGGSRDNLLREGFPANRIFVTGNPIREVMDRCSSSIGASTILNDLDIEERRFFLATVHRAENVDREDRLRGIIAGLELLGQRYGYPEVLPVHPRTRSKLEEFGIVPNGAAFRLTEPLGFFDFVRLEQAAVCLLSDSGTVQEEACLLGIPNVTLRDVTERPETLECGSNVLAGADPDAIERAVTFVMNRGTAWTPPAEYLAEGVAARACGVILSYRAPDSAELQWQSSRKNENTLTDPMVRS